MSLTKITKPKMAYLKAGFYGGQGSGKTRTATEVAIGLHKYIKSTKGVAFFDTETGSDFMVPLFNKHKIDLFTEKAKSFVALRDTIIQAPQFADILIIDSITHPWRELVKSYKAARHQKFLRIQDWGPLKEEWQQFSDLTSILSFTSSFADARAMSSRMWKMTRTTTTARRIGRP